MKSAYALFAAIFFFLITSEADLLHCTNKNVSSVAPEDIYELEIRTINVDTESFQKEENGPLDRFNPQRAAGFQIVGAYQGKRQIQFPSRAPAEIFPSERYRARPPQVTLKDSISGLFGSINTSATYKGGGKENKQGRSLQDIEIDDYRLDIVYDVDPQAKMHSVKRKEARKEDYDNKRVADGFSPYDPKKEKNIKIVMRGKNLVEKRSLWGYGPVRRFYPEQVLNCSLRAWEKTTQPYVGSTTVSNPIQGKH